MVVCPLGPGSGGDEAGSDTPVLWVPLRPLQERGSPVTINGRPELLTSLFKMKPGIEVLIPARGRGVSQNRPARVNWPRDIQVLSGILLNKCLSTCGDGDRETQRQPCAPPGRLTHLSISRLAATSHLGRREAGCARADDSPLLRRINMQLLAWLQEGVVFVVPFQSHRIAMSQLQAAKGVVQVGSGIVRGPVAGRGGHRGRLVGFSVNPLLPIPRATGVYRRSANQETLDKARWRLSRRSSGVLEEGRGKGGRRNDEAKKKKKK